MSGIYIQPASQFNGFEQQKESVLNIPGSYWLCHKNRIYKFIFRYHRKTRALKEFKHGKELMKIIRRIIKLQPPQGQQFCTRHLLVTYNRTYWVRQDKMLAILKFQEHSNATVVSQAILLTLKVLSPTKTIPEFSCMNVEAYDVNSGSDESNISDSKDLNTRDGFNTKKCNILLKNKITSEKHSEELNINNDPPVLQNERRTVKTNSNKSYTKELPSLDKFDFVNTVNREKDITRDTRDLQMDTSVNDEADVDSANVPYQYLIEEEIENQVYHKSVAREKESIITNFNHKLLDKMLEKFHSEENPNIVRERSFKDDDKQPINQRISETAKILENVHNNKNKNNYDFERKSLQSNNNFRSSNITDLIMEGRMFTIQQNQDTVSVLEQKTKLEIDEVLENSEKVETKEGEKWLLNSSLLKLENLITMIEVPKNNNTYFKSEHTVDNNNKTFPISNDSYSTCTSYDVIDKSKIDNEEPCDYHEQSKRQNPENITDSLNSLFDKNTKFNSFDTDIIDISKYESNIYETIEEEKAKQEENVLCRAIDSRNKEFTSKTINRVSNNTVDENLRINDEVSMQYGASSENDQDGSTKQKPNFPKIISNKIITIDEMPLVWRKVLKNKLKKHDASLNTGDEECTVAPKISNIRPTNTVFNRNTLSEVEQLDALQNMESATTSCDNKITINNNTLPATQNNTVTESNIEHHVKKKRCGKEDTLIPSGSSHFQRESMRMLRKGQHNHNCKVKGKLKKTETSLHSSGNTKNKHVNKLQDITDEFYQDLLQHQGNYTINQRCLRHRRRIAGTQESTEDNNVRIEIFKFIDDITRGAKVVVKRMSTKNISDILGKSSSLTACMN